MQKFSAAQFYRIVTVLTRIRALLEKLPKETLLGSSRSDAEVMLKAVRKECVAIGLRISMKCLVHMDNLVIQGAKIGAFVDGLSQLEKTIRWEMEDKLFMLIPPERAAFYDQPELLGKDVNVRFPSTQFDAVEAGNCYASGRGTAAVFHLMRIMEIGVQEFGTKLGVALTNEKNWQNILDETNKAIKGLNAKDPRTVQMSQASANLYSVKLAWRNEVMHPKDTYTLEEADNLIRQVKIFMEQLAKI